MLAMSSYWPAVDRPGYEAEAAIDFTRAPSLALPPPPAEAPADRQSAPAHLLAAESATEDRQIPATIPNETPAPAGAPNTDAAGAPVSDRATGEPVTTTEAEPAPGAAGDAPTSPPSRPNASSLLPRQTALETMPATWGWRGKVRRLSGGLISPKMTEGEMQHRAARVAVRRSFTRPMTVMFANPKGGAGKTPATLLAGATFGSSRGGYVVAWDNNETRGTLGVRGLMPDRDLTVWDLLRDLDRFERVDARAGDLAGYVRAQGEAQFDVLASDEAAENMAQIGVEEFERLRAVLSRFYKLVLVDTGNNVRATNWQAAAEAADLLVVCSSYRRDVAFSASWMLDHLESTGRADLARRAVTLLSAASPDVPPGARSEIVEHFTARTRAVVEIPYDAAIAPGERIDYNAVAPRTRDAWLFACAAIAAGLTEVDQKGTNK